MLARIAYQLYWIGRYVARAEHTARMLDGISRASLQARASSRRQALSWDAVMAIMGAELPEDGDITAADAVRALTLDYESPASVTACVKRAREGARTVRDVVSSEMWEALNTLYLELNSSDLRSALRTGPYSVYSFVRERCALWWGLADETMLRDAGYAFLLTGRHSESAEMIVRMLRVALSTPIDEEEDPSANSDRALALLQAVGGIEAYRRAETAPMESDSVAEFLIFEVGYPHSVTASIQALHDGLDEASGGGKNAPPVLRLARLRAELEFHRGSLHPATGRATNPAAVSTRSLAEREAAGGRSMKSLLEHIQRELTVIDTEVERRYFVGEAPQRQVITA